MVSHSAAQSKATMVAVIFLTGFVRIAFAFVIGVLKFSA
jgi:hypothetical protein